MIRKRPVLFFLFLFGAAWGFAQSTAPEELLKTGIGLYGEGRFNEAVTVLRLVAPGGGNHARPPYPEALYWTALAELSAGNFNEALRAMDTLEAADPRNPRIAELPYHRGRCLFYLGRHEEALVLLNNYAGALPESDSRKAASFYWMGESLFALGRLDSAAAAFSTVAEKYPASVKYEAARYRLDLINQKQVEAELLALLKWSHEESLKSLEGYQNREKTYDLAIASYQRRLGEILEEESARPAGYEDELARASERIALLEASLAEANAALEELRGGSEWRPASTLSDTEKALRIMELKAAALELSNKLTKKLNGEDE